MSSKLMVFTGNANPELAQKIANRLYLTVSTVKWHITHLYSKLGVTSRSDAVDRGRALGIL